MCHLCLCSTQHAPKMNSWSFPHKGGPIPALWNQETLSGTLYHCTKHHVLGFICLSPMPGSLSWSQPKSLSFYFLDYFFFFSRLLICLPTGFPFFPCCFSLSYFLHCHYIRKKDTSMHLHLLSQNSRMVLSYHTNTKILTGPFRACLHSPDRSHFTCCLILWDPGLFS